MNEYTLKFTEVRDKTLESITTMVTEQSIVVKKFNAFKTKLYLSLLLEFISKVFIASMLAVGISVLAGMNVTKYIFLIDLTLIFVIMLIYDKFYNRIEVRMDKDVENDNQRLVNAIAKLTRSYITRVFPGLFDKYLVELKSITDRLYNLHAGINSISNALSVSTFGFIQTLFDIPDDRMYYFGKDEEIRKALTSMSEAWRSEYDAAIEELNTICRAYVNDSGQYQAVLDELTMPLTLSLLQRYCRENIISRKELEDIIELDEETETLIYKLPIKTHFEYIVK